MRASCPLLFLAILVLGIIATTTLLAPCAYGWFPPVPPPPPDPGPLPVPEPIPDPPPTHHTPEPSTLVLLSLGAGMVGLKALRRRKNED